MKLHVELYKCVDVEALAPAQQLLLVAVEAEEMLVCVQVPDAASATVAPSVVAEAVCAGLDVSE